MFKCHWTKNIREGKGLYVTFLVTRLPSSSIKWSSVIDSTGTFLACSPWKWKCMLKKKGINEENERKSRHLWNNHCNRTRSPHHTTEKGRLTLVMMGLNVSWEQRETSPLWDGRSHSACLACTSVYSICIHICIVQYMYQYRHTQTYVQYMDCYIQNVQLHYNNHTYDICTYTQTHTQVWKKERRLLKVVPWKK